MPAAASHCNLTCAEYSTISNSAARAVDVISSANIIIAKNLFIDNTSFEFNKLIDRIKSGKIRLANKSDLHSRVTKIKASRSFGMAHRMRAVEEKMRRLDTCIPTYIVDNGSEEYKVVYLSREQNARIRELKASIQRPVKPVRPIKIKPDDKKDTGGDSK